LFVHFALRLEWLIPANSQHGNRNFVQVSKLKSKFKYAGDDD